MEQEYQLEILFNSMIQDVKTIKFATYFLKGKK